MNGNSDFCKTLVIHEDKINEVRKAFPDYQRIRDVADFFKVLGDPTRITIINALFQTELCVCDLSVILNMTPSAVSHQLRTLKQFALVKFRREGKVIYYSLCDEHVRTIFDMGLSHINEQKGGSQ